MIEGAPGLANVTVDAFTSEHAPDAMVIAVYVPAFKFESVIIPDPLEIIGIGPTTTPSSVYVTEYPVLAVKLEIVMYPSVALQIVGSVPTGENGGKGLTVTVPVEDELVHPFKV